MINELKTPLTEEVEELIKEDIDRDQIFGEQLEEAERNLNESFSLEHEFEELQERNIVKLSRKSKLKLATSRRAIEIAKETDDPLYKKYKKFNKLQKEFEKGLIKKYRNRALRDVKSQKKDK